jgi:alpha-glucosidase
VPTSTLELYRRALRLRYDHRLAYGDVEWLAAPKGVLAARRGDITVLTNTGPTTASVFVPLGGDVLLDSCFLREAQRLDAAVADLPPDTTWWVSTASR